MNKKSYKTTNHGHYKKKKIGIISVVNINKKSLNNQGYKDFDDWNSKENHQYIGRNMSFYVPGTEKSIWHNPFPVANPRKTYKNNTKRYTLDESLNLYREYIINNPELMNRLPELDGKVLGCWCKPNRCHGDIIKELLENLD